MSDFNYGGQAVIEGVMMRGTRLMAVAVRHPAGHVVLHSEPLTARIYTSGWGKLPFVRGLALLWDALSLGIRSLMFSADVALAEEEVEFGGPVAWGTVLVSLLLGVGLFFVIPLVLVGFVDRYLSSSLLSNLIEGVIRLVFFLGYILIIGLLPEIRRVFAYHGAEHKTVNAYEAGSPLDIASVRSFSTAHPRCGTGFLLVVMVVAILVFSLLGRPPMLLRIASRVLLIPVVAGLAYEFIRFTARHYQRSRLVRLLIAPSLALQSLTTREPDDAMLEVALTALRQVLVGEGILESSEAPEAVPAGQPLPA